MRDMPLIAKRTALGLMAALSSAAFSQDFPAKPIRVLTSSVGGGGDFAARLIADRLRTGAGWSVVVDNRPTIVEREIVHHATPDGYTILLLSSSLWVIPMLQKTPYDAVR